jgi:hypothetical protein
MPTLPFELIVIDGKPVPIVYPILEPPLEIVIVLEDIVEEFKVIVSDKIVLISCAINPTSLFDVIEQSTGAKESFM